LISELANSWVLVHETPGFAHLVMSVMARRLRGAGSTT
jgi:hypothetical protein